MNRKRTPPPVLADIKKFKNKEDRELKLQKAFVIWFKEDQAISRRRFIHIDALILKYLREQEALKIAAEMAEKEGIVQELIPAPALPD